MSDADERLLERVRQLEDALREAIAAVPPGPVADRLRFILDPFAAPHAPALPARFGHVRPAPTSAS